MCAQRRLRRGSQSSLLRVVSVTALLEANPNPTDDQIREGLSGNLCRCTGYQGIVEAVKAVAGP